MATRVIDDTKLNDIAVAIQAKDNGGQMTVDEMPTRIANIPSGGATLIPKTITENGVYNASSDNADGYDIVTVDVPQTLATQIVDGSITEYVDNNTQSIRDTAFYGCKNLHTVIADNVITVGAEAFRGCSSLTNIKLKNVITIGDNAFREVSISSNKYIFKNAKTIGNYAFYNVSFAAIDIRNVEKIGVASFPSKIIFYDLTNVDTPPILGINNFYSGAANTGTVAVKNDTVKQNFLNATNWSNVTIIKTIAEIEAEVGMSYDDYYYQIFGEPRNEV